MTRLISHVLTKTALLALTAVALLLPNAGCSMKEPVKVSMTGNINAATSLKPDNTASRVRSRTLPGESRCLPKIAVIDVDGLLVNRNMTAMQSMGENPVALLREKLDAAAADDCVRAIVLRVNSPGGGVTASDIMQRDLERFRMNTGKPVVACVMDVGAGGAYYLATSADVICAHHTSLIGGIGVVLNLYDLQDTMSQFNVAAMTIRSGKKIDLGSPMRTLEEDEQKILERIALEYHHRFRDAVRERRSSLMVRLPEALPKPPAKPLTNPAAGDEDDGEDDEDTEEEASDEEDDDEEDEDRDEFDGTIFDGRVFTATEAQRLGLVDQLGYLDDAIETAERLAGLSASQTVVFKRCNDRALTTYDITPNLPGQALVPLSIPGLDRSQLPTFLYLWQPEPAYEKNGG